MKEERDVWASESKGAGIKVLDHTPCRLVSYQRPLEEKDCFQLVEVKEECESLSTMLNGESLRQVLGQLLPSFMWNLESDPLKTVGVLF